MHPFVELAKKTVVEFVTKNQKPELPAPLPEDLKQRAGVFVSLKKFGELRGCIGTLSPVRENLAEEIMENAISSASRDSRFNPVEEGELKDISYSVDVLSPAEDISSVEELNPDKYGVIVSSGVKRGVLLPNLEGVNSPEHQIEICRNKAGIYPDEPITLQRFTVARYR